MTNPGNAIGTNGGYGGRTSVNAFNDVLALSKSRGVVSGWYASPATGLAVKLGGNGTVRDVAIAEDDTGNRTTVNNISEQPVSVTLAEAPTLGQRIDTIVAYVSNPPEGSNTAIDNPAACGLIAVAGEVATTPVEATEQQIRTAITADGGTGVTAYYVVLAKVLVLTGATDIVADNITQGDDAGVGIEVDDHLDATSHNPVENRVITATLGDISTILTQVNTKMTNLDTGNGVVVPEEGGAA